MPQLQINATQARKNLFELIDLVALKGMEVVISKKGLDDNVVLKSANGSGDLAKRSVEEELELVRSSYGSVKTSGYKKNEMELMKRAFVRNYKKKHNL
ncbi:hypothetical protein A2630_02410 [Candidatus Woesebacteria bacterium RIFCSPHIGHO2_01_FULL_44_10]|uniref:Uncharacterized protein n=1 Tax=Candidatus Woesebacteria bacterium RIFCSPLOWO2_01_FULL_44_14 TaxID=1802525 RepID=A0A1F8C1D7_9BACT|nr:MAG: hypothetical protein A2630_02410 [Candidatus Woesebacteria bacterium RIFCSPHIGHO2_01_FULL_44_10]OGM69950.1 MAG: hypothetical protein A2975_05070 [Candidatus Woesebacteria bacterium RIFCSPLOWO2_01_FULL_44_14]